MIGISRILLNLDSFWTKLKIIIIIELIERTIQYDNNLNVVALSWNQLMLNEDEYLNVNCKNFTQKFVQFVAIVSLMTFDIFVFIILCSWKNSGKYVLILAFF